MGQKIAFSFQFELPFLGLTMTWDIIDTGIASAEKNMALDYELLQRLSSSAHPILHFYRWEKRCATYGHFINPYDHLNEQAVRRCDIELAKRPTGGGILFHHCDYAFSVLIPENHPAYSTNTIENYAAISQKLAEVIRRFHGKEPTLHSVDTPDELAQHFCMAKPTINDVMLDGRKVSGGAQRRKKNGFLHQGTMALISPLEEELSELLIKGVSLTQVIQRNSYPLLGDRDLEDAKQELQKLIIEVFTEWNTN